MKQLDKAIIIFRLDPNRNGGGVAMFVRKSIPQDQVNDALELLCIQVRKIKKKPLLNASTWYRPPSCSHDLF